MDCLDDLGREYTKRLAASAQQMEKLINDLLSYSRLSRTEINQQSVCLTSVVATALSELDSQIIEIQAQITIDQPLLSILGNRTIVLQIVSNLLSNALKFRACGVQPQIHIWTEAQNNYVRLWIEDNGNISRAFLMFSSGYMVMKLILVQVLVWLLSKKE